jgi:hypothetical protein
MISTLCLLVTFDLEVAKKIQFQIKCRTIRDLIVRSSGRKRDIPVTLTVIVKSRESIAKNHNRIKREEVVNEAESKQTNHGTRKEENENVTLPAHHHHLQDLPAVAPEVHHPQIKIHQRKVQDPAAKRKHRTQLQPLLHHVSFQIK